MTRMVTVVDSPPEVTVIVVLPSAKAVQLPVVGSTLAMLGSAIVQV